MKIRFGLALDGQHGWRREGGLGCKTVGPLGLLNILETHLGLLACKSSQAERVIAYRACLARADNGDRFYSSSFASDPIGVASTLLQWRDDLYLHGWNGSWQDHEMPRRLTDLGMVEAQAGVEEIPPCIGERLARVARQLRQSAISIDSVMVVDEASSLPPRWRDVLDLLPTTYLPVPRCDSGPHSSLGKLRGALAEDAGDGSHWRNDGSVVVVSAETPLAGAYWTADFLRTAAEETLVIGGGHCDLLDDVLKGMQLPRHGLGSCTPFRPALEVLPLAMRLLWAPVDLHAALAFLTLPIAPMKREVRRVLAAAIAESPGFNGPEWKRALTQVLADSDDADRTLSEIVFWLLPERASTRDGAPVEAVVRRAQRVSEFFRAQLAHNNALRQSAALSGYGQATAFLGALESMLKQGETHLRPSQVEQLLSQATAHGLGQPLSQRELGSVMTVTDPEAVCEAADTVLWWWACVPPEAERMPWRMAERTALAANGVQCPSNEELVAWQAKSWLRPVLAARKKLVLVVPSAVEARHPVWQAIEAAVRHGAQAELPLSAVLIPGRVEDGLAASAGHARMPEVAHQALPAPKRWWAVDGASFDYSKGKLSYSALNLLLNDPHQWVLRYVAKLRESEFLQISDGPLLYGTLAHRAVEKLVAAFKPSEMNQDRIGAWFDAEFPILVEQEGAVLLAAGRGAELARVRRQTLHAVVALADIIRNTGSDTVHSEYALEGEFKGGALTGSADLVLRRPSGEHAIIDMKWGSRDKHRKALADGAHLQLVLYAEMLRQQTRAVPALAYFIIGSTHLLAAEPGYFDGADCVREANSGTVGAIWLQFLQTLAWRGEQLRGGLAEVTTSGAEPDGDSVPPADGLPLQPLVKNYNVYRNLTGWDA